MSIVKRKKINCKNKGNRYELQIVNLFKKLGYPKAASSRATSRILDNCKIDINFIPFLVQAKSGYLTARPKYDILKKECIELVNKNFPKEEAKNILSKPFILFHKIKANNEIISIDLGLFMEFMKYKAFKEFCEDLYPQILKQYDDSRIL